MIDFAKWALSLIGHVGLWCLLFNWLHATAFSRPGRKLSEKAVLLAVFAPMVWVLIQWIRLRSCRFELIYSVSTLAYWYGWACLVMGVLFVIGWAIRKLTERVPESVTRANTELLDVAAVVGRPLLHGRIANWLGKIPGNQATWLAVERKSFLLPSMPRSLNGLKISHLSDLHFTGQVDVAFFDEVVRRSNEFSPDLIILTGDIVEEAECVSWIEDCLGKLISSTGKFYVLGNHDLRIKDETRIRECMSRIGFTGLQDQWETIEIQGTRVGLAGNEIPWFRGAEKLPKRLAEDGFDFRMLLSHSPDQFPWALDYEFDLMFAGHTHGGQIRFPIIGPVIAPSRFGVKYCAGTFEFGQMLMHVSRGLSGDEVIRINCPPELGLFTLLSDPADSSS